MAYSIKKEDIINYLPHSLNSFHGYMFEWIDNLNFTISPGDILSNADEYIEIAKSFFAKWVGLVMEK